MSEVDIIFNFAFDSCAEGPTDRAPAINTSEPTSVPTETIFSCSTHRRIPSECIRVRTKAGMSDLGWYMCDCFNFLYSLITEKFFNEFLNALAVLFTFAVWLSYKRYTPIELCVTTYRACVERTTSFAVISFVHNQTHINAIFQILQFFSRTDVAIFLTRLETFV